VLPLAGLLAASRPSTLREWGWITAAILWLGTSLASPGGLGPQLLVAWALFLTGGFAVLMLSGEWRVVPGALLASLASLGAAAAWTWWLGTRWAEIQFAVTQMGWEARRQLLEQAALDPSRMESVRILMDLVTDGVAMMAQLFPAMLILASLPGLALAWAWYHRLAAHPVGSAAEPFARFRFSDQLVWLVVLCVALLVLPVAEPIREVTGNLAVVTGGLYAARGAAIIWGSIESFPLPVLLVIGIGVVLILPVALGAAFALGLADTWVDFRRRFSPPTQKGAPHGSDSA
jgi:hypothetical protein